MTAAVRDEHALRIVDEDAEEILLGNRGPEQEHGARQTEQQDGEKREAQADQHQSIPPRAHMGNAAVSEQGRDPDGDGSANRERHGPRGCENQLALFEDDGRILEEEAEDQIEHPCILLEASGCVHLWREMTTSFGPTGAKPEDRRAKQLLVATTSAGKLAEIRELLDGVGFDILTLADLPPTSAPEEAGRTFAENARAKARYYAARTGLLTVAEDSGLEIEALGGLPGVESARYGGADSSYPRKFELIFDALRAAGAPGSAARFVCALAVAQGDQVVFEALGYSGRPDRAGTARRRRVRLRPHLLLPAVWLHAGRGWST